MSLLDHNQSQSLRDSQKRQAEQNRAISRVHQTSVSWKTAALLSQYFARDPPNPCQSQKRRASTRFFAPVPRFTNVAAAPPQPAKQPLPDLHRFVRVPSLIGCPTSASFSRIHNSKPQVGVVTRQRLDGQYLYLCRLVLTCTCISHRRSVQHRILGFSLEPIPCLASSARCSSPRPLAVSQA